MEDIGVVAAGLGSAFAPSRFNFSRAFTYCIACDSGPESQLTDVCRTILRLDDRGNVSNSYLSE
jgi:hypothetical protein